MRHGEDQDHPEGHAAQSQGHVGQLEAHGRHLLVTEAEDRMPLLTSKTSLICTTSFRGQEVDRPE